MAVRLTPEQIGVVKCPTNTNTKTVDGASHEMVRAFPLIVLPEGKNDQKSFSAALANWLGVAGAIAAGEEIEIVDADGKPITTTKPTDDIPKLSDRSESKRREKDPKTGEEVEFTDVTVNHGQNFPRNLPVDFAKLVDAINTGIRADVRLDGIKKITEEFREEGKRGRAAQVFDASKLA